MVVVAWGNHPIRKISLDSSSRVSSIASSRNSRTNDARSDTNEQMGKELKKAPSCKMRRALGHKVEPDPKAYKRREKHTKPLAKDEPE